MIHSPTEGLRARMLGELLCFSNFTGISRTRILDRARINHEFFKPENMARPMLTSSADKIFAAMRYFDGAWIFRFQRVQDLTEATELWCQAHGSASTAIAAELRDRAAWRLHKWPDQCTEEITFQSDKGAA